jgi:hypothetical protein
LLESQNYDCKRCCCVFTAERVGLKQSERE